MFKLMFTYSVEEGSAIVEFLLEGDAFSLGDGELAPAVVELALGLFQSAFQVLKERRPKQLWNMSAPIDILSTVGFYPKHSWNVFILLVVIRHRIPEIYERW